jgi:membrane-anchored glycerophosphoryl diester phosphodiesterase (GDPDase)
MTTPGYGTGTLQALKPGVGSSYGNGWKMLWPHFLVLFLIGLIFFVLNMIIQVPSWMVNGFFGNKETALSGATLGFGFISLLYSIFFINPVNYGQSFAYLKAARNDKVDVQDMFEVFKNYWNAVGSNILVSLIVIVGFILLIVPGIIFACKLAFVPYLIVDRKMSVMDAIKESWHMTKGYAGKVFLICLLGIPIGIAGLICLGVGVIISFMWISMASACCITRLVLRDPEKWHR